MRSRALRPHIPIGCPDRHRELRSHRNLVAGNTFVLLAHEFTPLSGLELAKLAQAVGIPEGVFNVVTGRGPVIGQALVECELSDLVTMTGSTRAGSVRTLR